MVKSSPLLGAHVSIAGSLCTAIKQGEELNCNAIQIFTHSSRQWAFHPLASTAIEEFIKAQAKSSIEMVIVHASYLMNPASPEQESRKKAEQMLKLELKACDDLQAPFLVLHPGSRLESDIKTSLKNCADTINRALEVPGNAKILLENMAGQGSAICSNLEELQEVYDHIENKQRVGFCFDTCHAFAAGYDFTTHENYTIFWEKFDKFLGIKNLHAIHVNDSIKPINSRVDRHTDIGQGKIGIEAFRQLMNDDRFKTVAKIIETPKGNGLEEDIMNLATLKSLLKK